MSYTADSLFEYMQGIADQVDEQYGSGYSTEEERQAYHQHMYDALAAREAAEESLWAADDDVLAEALDIMEDANYHTESAALIAYMYKIYGWEPSWGIDQEKQYAPYLYD